MSLLIFVAVILSSVSRLFITRCHLFSISLSVWLAFWITLSQRSTHIKCSASEIRICNSLLIPGWCRRRGAFSFSFSVGARGGEMAPHPRMMPRDISGKGMLSCGHNCLASCHILWTAGVLHCVSMCSIVSVTWQVLHSRRFSCPLTFCQKVPTFGV